MAWYRIRHFWLFICLAAVSTGPPIPAEAQSAPSRACVVLLHGLARTSRSMAKMADALEQAGYYSVNMSYPSRTATIEQSAMQVIPEAIRQCDAAQCGPVHFVTHSMGAILLRQFLSNEKIDRLGRVVMISPPNQGSEAAEALKTRWYYRKFNGPAGQQLGTGPDGIAARLGAVDYPTGVITGNMHSFFDGWLARIIPGEDDGKVSVERAKVAGMRDFLVLPYSHPFIMAREETISQTQHFLVHGHFRTPSIEPE